MSSVELRLPPASLVNASPPASVAAGNVERFFIANLRFEIAD
jgi:N-methylhydantoinase B/oxoprolinase/acetone carboxylase alpha subunit